MEFKMDLEGSSMVNVYLEKFEDFSDKILRVIKPYARGLAMLCILFFHLIVSLLIVFDYTNMSLFVNWVFGLYSYRSIEAAGRDRPENESSAREGLPVTGHLFTLAILLTRIIPPYFIFIGEHVAIACAVLGALPLALGLHFAVNAPVHSYWIVWTCVSLVGSLGMLVSESFKEKDIFVAGLPSLGINKKMSVITLIARVTVMAVYFQIEGGIQRNLFVYDNFFAKWAHLAVTLPPMICVLVGFKTKAAAVYLAVVMCLVSCYLYPFWMYLNEPFGLGIYTSMFSANLAAVGGLFYITILGAGQFSVDHMKKS